MTAPAAASPLLQVSHLHCDYDGQPAVVDVSLSLTSGELGCLLGPSGCGKTTLLRAVAGLHEAQHGELRLRGRVANALPPEQRGIGFVFQDLALFPHLDVAGNIAFGLHKSTRAAASARTREMLALLGLQELAGRFPHELSGGQQQRVAVARALAPGPDLLLLDEPFSSLDADLRGRLRDELRALLKRLGTTALLVTHDQTEAFAFADTVGVMRAGRLLQWAPGYDVYHRPNDAFVAKFVGDGRFLRGRVRDAGSVQTTLGVLTPAAPLTQAPGADVLVLMRPDDVRPGGTEDIGAEVVGVAFRGAETCYTLRLDDGEEVDALFPSHRPQLVGDRIRVRLDLEHVVVFPVNAE